MMCEFPCPKQCVSVIVAVFVFPFVSLAGGGDLIWREGARGSVIHQSGGTDSRLLARQLTVEAVIDDNVVG